MLVVFPLCRLGVSVVNYLLSFAFPAAVSLTPAALATIRTAADFSHVVAAIATLRRLPPGFTLHKFSFQRLPPSFPLANSVAVLSFIAQHAIPNRQVYFA
jgi:hypothetical protein